MGHINSIHEGGPADRAGLKIGDEVVQIGNTKVSTLVEARSAIQNQARVGESLKWVVHRGPKEDPLRAEALTKGKPFVGFGLLERQTTSSGKHVTETQPLQVESVYQDGPAWDAGLRLGDEVLEMGRGSVKNLGDVRNVVQATKVGQNLPIVRRRNGKTENLTLKVATNEAKFKPLNDL